MVKIKILIIISLGCLLQLSCGKTSIKDIIDDGSYKYWRKNWTENCDELYYFDNNGNWGIFEGCRNTPFTQYIEFEEYDGGDNIITNTWKFENDSIIYINGDWDFHITILQDTIMLLKCEFRTDTLYAVPKQRIPPKFRKKHF